MAYSDYIVFVDESGDHSLQSIDEQYPVFALTFCIFRKRDYIRRVVPMVQLFKFKHFGHDSVVLHEHEIRKQTAPFAFLQSQATRAVFMDDLNRIMVQAPMTIVAAIIHKSRLVQRYIRPENPYEIALLFCIERLFRYLDDHQATGATTHVVVERRGRKEDAALELEFRRICDGGNRCGRISCLDIVFVDKKANSTGLQLADLTARPIGLRCMRPDQPNRAYDIIEPKLRRSPQGRVDGWGFKVFP